MFSKSILILLTATLFSTSSVFAMDGDERCSQAYKRLQKRQDEKDKVYRPGWERVLDLYHAHVDYHIHMKNFITEESCKPNKEKLCAILGMPLHSTFIDKAIDDLRKFHQHQAQVSQEFIDCRQRPGQILKKVALTYCYSITSQIDCELIIEENKQKFQQMTNCQENEINDYQVRAPKDQIQFHMQVQQRILEEFSPHLKAICENMIELTGQALRDNPADEEYRAFYKSVVDKTYTFPTNLKIEEIIFEETPNSDGGNKKKRKPRKRRKKTTDVKNADAVLNLKGAETSSLVEKNSEINLSQNKSDIQTEKKPLLAVLAEESRDKRNLLEDKLKEGELSSLAEKKSKINLPQVETDIKTEHEPLLAAHAEESEDLLPGDNLKEESSDWKQELDKQTQKDREQKRVPKKRLRTNEVEEPQPILIKKAEIGKAEHLFLTNIYTTLLTDPNIEWKKVVNLFNNPNGFKGKVYGTSGGGSNTFEVFMKFKDGKFIEFLSNDEFKSLKAKAHPELLNERTFLKTNTKLASYRLPAGESIATSSFMLHRPHQPCLYMALLKRLRDQLDLLGLSPETVQSRD
jgi:hypothetical protein